MCRGRLWLTALKCTVQVGKCGGGEKEKDYWWFSFLAGNLCNRVLYLPEVVVCKQERVDIMVQEVFVLSCCGTCGWEESGRRLVFLLNDVAQG